MTHLARLAPPIVLMVVIWLLSAQPGLDSGLSFDFVLRKFAHMAEFGLLWWLWWRTLQYDRPGGLVIATVIALGYAAVDEWHQSTVEGRHGTPVDWLIDAAGVGLAALIAVALRRRVA